MIESHQVSPAATCSHPCGPAASCMCDPRRRGSKIGAGVPPYPPLPRFGLASGSLLPVPLCSPLLGKCGPGQALWYMPSGPPTCPWAPPPAPASPRRPLGHLPVLLLPGLCRPCLVPYLSSCLSVSVACPPGELGDPSLHALSPWCCCSPPPPLCSCPSHFPPLTVSWLAFQGGEVLESAVPPCLSPVPMEPSLNVLLVCLSIILTGRGSQQEI